MVDESASTRTPSSHTSTTLEVPLIDVCSSISCQLPGETTTALVVVVPAMSLRRPSWPDALTNT